MFNEEKFYSTLRKRLSELKGDKTNEEFAKTVEASESALRSWMHGEKNASSRLPRANNIIQICKATGVTADWLLGLSDVKTNISGLDALGLSSEVLDYLIEQKRFIDEHDGEVKAQCDKSILFALEKLLKTADGKRLLLDLGKYLHTDFYAPTAVILDSKTGQAIEGELVCIDFKNNDRDKRLTYDPEDFEDAVLEKIKDQVRMLKDNCINESYFNQEDNTNE